MSLLAFLSPIRLWNRKAGVSAPAPGGETDRVNP